MGWLYDVSVCLQKSHVIMKGVEEHKAMDFPTTQSCSSDLAVEQTSSN